MYERYKSRNGFRVCYQKIVITSEINALQSGLKGLQSLYEEGIRT